MSIVLKNAVKDCKNTRHESRFAKDSRQKKSDDLNFRAVGRMTQQRVESWHGYKDRNTRDA